MSDRVVFRVEEVRAGLVEAQAHLLARLELDVADMAHGEDAELAAVDVEHHVGAQILADLDRAGAMALPRRHHRDVLGPGAEPDRRAAGASTCERALAVARQAEAIAVSAARHHVHLRAADELGDEQVGRALVQLARRAHLLDLPGLRVINISADVRHRILNYGVVFAPRAGHHSNIAERVALFLRDKGLTRMVVVEQKCAEEIPLYVNGRRHREDFEGQVDQYTAVLKYLKKKTGRPPHLIAICQPGPLLMATLILNPGLAKTFGSAGSPMHTEAESGILTDFARTVGEAYIDRLLTLFGLRIEDNCPGAGRTAYDGRLQVLGFYLMGFDLHYRNLKNLLIDLKTGNHRGAERQKAFYQWYNSVQHFPAGFIRDTFKKIFIHNDLVRGTLQIGKRQIGIADFPGTVPIWALGGTQDTIAPPLQATGHMEMITSVPPQRKLTLMCDGGHMGLFRSRKILENDYTKIAAFLLAHSDRASFRAA